MREKSRDIYFLGILGVIATLPFDISINSISIVFFLLTWINLLIHDWDKLISELKQNKIAQLMILFGIVYALSALVRYSSYEDFEIILKDLELRISFVIFPLGLAGLPLLNKSKIRILFRFYVGVIFLATIICLIFSLIATIQTGSVYQWDSNYHFVENVFMYHRLTSWIGVHAIYFSAYVSIAFYIVFVQFLNRYRANGKKAKYRKLSLFLLVYFMAIIFLLKSITISIAFLLTLIIVVIYYLMRDVHWNKKRIISASIAGAIVLASFGTMMINKFSAKDSILSYNMEDEYPDANWNSLNLRLAKWEISRQVLREAWLFGVGPGNIIEVLDTYYEKNNFHFALQQHYNPHNQFLHTFIVLGISGLAILLGIYFKAYEIAFRRRDVLFGIFIFIFTIFSLSESILAVNKGVVFFCFFMNVFSYLKTKTSGYLGHESSNRE